MIAGATALGLGLGIVSGVPLGVINIAIVDAAGGGRIRFATGIGLGGAFADMIQAGLAFAGVGHLVTTRPDLTRYFAIGAACVIAAYVVFAWRNRRTPRPPSDESSLIRGALAGCVLTLPNPGALGAWVAVAASIWPDASVVEAIALALGVGLGSAGWFSALARWVGRVRPDHPALTLVPRIALVVLGTIAVIGVARVL